MQYLLQNTTKGIPLIERLFTLRNIIDDPKGFLNPSFEQYRHDPFLLEGMEKTVNFLIQAMKDYKKIMIFGDYDVDGVSASFLLYYSFQNYFKYKHISVMFPDRMKDGYGLKTTHIDEMDDKNIDIIITVDNGINSVQEAQYAKQKGLTLIITDHHEPGPTIPDAYSVINPKISPQYPCSFLAGAGVAFKLIAGILSQTTHSDADKKHIFQSLIPNVAIATVADIVPLQDENRLFVYKGLEMMNKKEKLLPSLSGFLDFLNIKKIDTFHIGFLIGPRINAAGRISSPYDAFFSLLTNGHKQTEYLQKLDTLNTQRKSIQEKALKIAETQVNQEDPIIIVYDPSFHEGVVGIVAGRLADKRRKPSVVLTKKEDGIITGSLRGPEYFNVVKMIQTIKNDLLSSGGHAQAGGISFEEKNMQKVREGMITYCTQHIGTEQKEKTIAIDTEFYKKEWTDQTLEDIARLGPFGEGNPEPVFLFRHCDILTCKKIGKNGNGHLKLHIKFGKQTIEVLFRRKGAQIEEFQQYLDKKKNIYGKIKADTFKGGRMIEGVGIE